MAGLRLSELLGLRWRDVAGPAERTLVRIAYMRGEHSGGKSDRSTRRSVPMAIIVAPDIECWSQRTRYSSADDLVPADLPSGRPLSGPGQRGGSGRHAWTRASGWCRLPQTAAHVRGGPRRA